MKNKIREEIGWEDQMNISLTIWMMRSISPTR